MAATFSSTLAAIDAAPISAALAEAAVRRAVEIAMLGCRGRRAHPSAVWPCSALEKGNDESREQFEPFVEIQAVHAEISDSGGDGSSARGVRDFLRSYGPAGQQLAAATSKLRKLRNGKGHPPVGLAKKVRDLIVSGASTSASEHEEASVSGSEQQPLHDRTSALATRSTVLEAELAAAEALVSTQHALLDQVRKQAEVDLDQLRAKCAQLESELASMTEKEEEGRKTFQAAEKVLAQRVLSLVADTATGRHFIAEFGISLEDPAELLSFCMDHLQYHK